MRLIQSRVENTKAIIAFVHCSMCLDELPEGTSPQEWQYLEVGWTKEGLQVWCKRHDCNVMHIDFEGAHHPANTSVTHKSARSI